MGYFEISCIVATLFCSLVAGLVFSFAVVVMPGIRRLGDREFVRAFQVIDSVIQDNQPLFMIVWVGSTLSLILTAVIGVFELGGISRVLLVIATLVYVFFVQVPTVAINIPLNNHLQTLDVGKMNEQAICEARIAFEGPWNRWNVIRTCCATLSSLLLLVLLTIR